jgi:tRNA-specific 2-thiouridylase
MMAMSGGVDSSVAAALLREQGYDLVGVAMRLTPDSVTAAPRRGTCCSYDDFEDARRVAEMLDFPFYVVDLRDAFRTRVIDNFVAEYLEGRTPNPCVMCNREIKFDRLWQRATALECAYVATGHYARIERDEAGLYHLMRARDTAKDQSYFLFNLDQSQLSRTLFPLAMTTKQEVRTKAHALGLTNADKPESQEICFVPDGDYAGLVERMAVTRPRHGRIVGEDGTVLGRHNGIHRFTIGQRRGLGVSSREPLYVSSINSSTGDVEVAGRERLNVKGLVADQFQLVSRTVTEGLQFRAEVKIRYRNPPIPANITLISIHEAEIRFDHDGPAVTPGQACVLYRGDEVLGGGVIRRALED